MDLATKKEIMLEALKEDDFIEIFDIVENEECLLLETTQSILGGECRIDIVLCDEGYDSVHYNICKLNFEEKRMDMIHLLNELNDENKIIKFRINEDDYIVGSVTYLNNEEFEAELLVKEIMIKTFMYIKEISYPKIMKVMWS